MKQKIVAASILGVIFVLSTRLLNSVVLGRLMLPGILLGSLAPDAHWSWKGADDPGPISITIFYAVNLVLYSGLAYALLTPLWWLIKNRRS